MGPGSPPNQVRGRPGRQHLVKHALYERASLSRTAAGSASQTQACCANHSWLVRHSGQKTRPKNTGVALKLSRSATSPVEMSRPVSGHLIITTPIDASSLFSLSNCSVLTSVACERQIAAGCDDDLTRARRDHDCMRVQRSET